MYCLEPGATGRPQHSLIAGEVRRLSCHPYALVIAPLGPIGHRPLTALPIGDGALARHS